MTDAVQEPTVLGGDAAPKPVEPALVYHDRPVPADWERRLREISPMSQDVSWLALHWLDWCERWAVYECVPNQFIDIGFRAELEGPHPDSLDDWARICSRHQWEMYRKHRVHARPFWIIQGTRGGNKVAFDPIDQELCRAAGLPTQPPAPGSLPYAPFDERVVRQLLARNKLLQVRNDLTEFRKRNAHMDGWKRTYRDALQQARAQYVAYINEQFTEGDEHFADALRKGELDDAPRTEKEYVKENEAADQKYILTGRF